MSRGKIPQCLSLERLKKEKEELDRKAKELEERIKEMEQQEIENEDFVFDIREMFNPLEVISFKNTDLTDVFNFVESKLKEGYVVDMQ